MAISGTDAYGPYIDTGVSTAPTVRPNVEVETHAVNEVDTGSKLSVTQIVASHSGHRPPNSPR